jgi:hypothetical protein
VETPLQMLLTAGKVWYAGDVKKSKQASQPAKGDAVSKAR